MSDIKKEISRTKTGLVLDHAFFGSLALTSDVLLDEKLDTPKINGKNLIINPEQFMKESINVRKGIMAAGYLGMGLGHPFRMGDRDAKMWGEASSIITGMHIRQGGMQLPVNWPAHPKFNLDTTIEEGYKILSEEPKQDGPGGGDGDGDDQQDGDGQGGYGVDPPPSPDQQDGDDDGEGQQEGAGDGGCGVQRPPTPAEMKAMEEDWKVRLAQAAQAAKAMGKLPESLKSLVDDTLEAKIPWQHVLRDFIEKVEHDDYSWNQPNRRWIQQGLVLPSLHNLVTGDIIVAFDTSGSVGDNEIAQFFGELSSILSEFPGSKCTLLEVDTRVANVTNFTTDDLPIGPRHAHGRGGTMFSPAFEWVDEHEAEFDEAPSCFIYLTDGECNDFPAPPNYPVLWVYTQEPGKQGSWCSRPPFGTLTVID